MTNKMKMELSRMAAECVSQMGDIFWDRDSYGDRGEYVDPMRVAKESVERTLVEFAERKQWRRTGR